jgi:hypothetical protein
MRGTPFRLRITALLLISRRYDGAIFTRYGRGLINKTKIPVQELVGQRGEGAYFSDQHGIIPYSEKFSHGANFALFMDRFSVATIRIAKLEKTGCHTSNRSTWVWS